MLQGTLETKTLESVNACAGHFTALDAAARYIAVFGLLPLFLGAIMLACFAERRHQRRAGWLALFASLAAALAMGQIAPLFSRPSPSISHPVKLLLCPSGGLSSPSWEMAAIAAICAMSIFYLRRMRWVIGVYAFLAGIAGVYCGVNYPLDQALSCLVGVSSAVLITVVCDCRSIMASRERRYLVPAVAAVLCAATPLLAHIPSKTHQTAARRHSQVLYAVNEEKAGVIKGWTPDAERRIARALGRVSMPGRVLRIAVGADDYVKVAAVKFDAGTDANPIPRPLLQKEALQIIKAGFMAAPDISEIDVWAVTSSRNDGTMRTVFSVAAKRSDAAFLLGSKPSMLSTQQALARFGLVSCEHGSRGHDR